MTLHPSSDSAIPVDLDACRLAALALQLRSELESISSAEAMATKLSSSPTLARWTAMRGRRSLTDRELQVLVCSARGMGCTQSAVALRIGVHTIKKHRANALHKLGLRNTTELVRYIGLWSHRAMDMAETRRLANSLTIRERSIAWYVSHGNTCKQIARLLGISSLTVRKHRENLLGKLQLRHTTELVISGVVDDSWRTS
jgi:DNA-binding CsgD family transcriptional regulator